MKDNMTEIHVRILKCKARRGNWSVYEVEVLKRSDWDENIFNPIEVVQMTGEFENIMYPNEEYICYGMDSTHKSWGYQFKCSIIQNKFDTPSNLKTFLLSMVAPSIAEQLISKYGDALIDKITNREVNTDEIYGMGSKRFESLYQKVTENRYIKDLIVGLSQYGITPNQMKQIATKFKGKATEKIKENPYCLCEIRGISFKKADEIAKRMNFDMESMHRISEGIKYTLEEAMKSGHSWIKKDKVISDCVELMEVSRDRVKDGLAFGKDLYVDQKRVSLEKVYNAECDIAEILKKIQSEKIVLDFDVDKFIEEQENILGITLTEEQRSFFYRIKEERVNFLVGYAGCGKSQLQKMVVELIKQLKQDAILLCPTGKAAKNLESYTQTKAFTIHKAVHIYGNSDDIHSELWHEWIVVDESSMPSVDVLQKLLKCIKNPRARLIFVGDDWQIPSIGVGAFLYDCITKNSFSRTRLTNVFRQKDGGILDVATKIRNQQKFIHDGFDGEMKFGSDMVIRSVKQDYILDGILFYYKKSIKLFGIDETVILTPTNKGKLGTQSINNKIQELVNPQDGFKAEAPFGKFVIFREGDKVIHVKNTYDVQNVANGEDSEIGIDVMNGDMGYIKKIENQHVYIEYSNGMIKIPFNSLDIIKHGWVLTPFKAQGSGFDCVISVIDKSSTFQLNANLLYTTVTRSKKMHYMLCQANIINSAMKKVESQARNTFLPELL